MRITAEPSGRRLAGIVSPENSDLNITYTLAVQYTWLNGGAAEAWFISIRLKQWTGMDTKWIRQGGARKVNVCPPITAVVFLQRVFKNLWDLELH